MPQSSLKNSWFKPQVLSASKETKNTSALGSLFCNYPPSSLMN